MTLILSLLCLVSLAVGLFVWALCRAAAYGEAGDE